MAVGIALLVIGAVLPATTTTTERGDECYWAGGELICNQHTVEEPSPLRTIVLLLGGFVFSGGWGGWIGTYNAERRLEGRLEELNVVAGGDDSPEE